VKDTTRHSKFYRVHEPVAISVGDSQRPRSYQYITLTESEWTAYTIDSNAPQVYEVTLRARATRAPAEAELMVGKRTKAIKVSESNWTEIKLGPIEFDRGPNQLKWIAKQGTVDLDWLEVNEVSKPQSATRSGYGSLAEIGSSD
jgi:hypothetical protein